MGSQCGLLAAYLSQNRRINIQSPTSSHQINNVQLWPHSSPISSLLGSKKDSQTCLLGMAPGWRLPERLAELPMGRFLSRRVGLSPSFSMQLHVFVMFDVEFNSFSSFLFFFFSFSKEKVGKKEFTFFCFLVVFLFFFFSFFFFFFF